jgi:hypothetical protein
MNLKSFLPGSEKEEPVEYFWSLIIEPGWVQAGIWRIKGDMAQIVHGSAAYPWELDDELVNASDTALAGAIAGFPEGLEEPSKTVFGVISTWVTEGQIKDEYLERIKRICSDLSLTPIGFVVVPEAISHLLKSEEGAPLNGILVGVYKDVLEVSVYKFGNLMGTTLVNRSLSVIEDMTEGISRFAKGDAVPSRIILYDGKDGELEDTKHALSQVAWEDITQIQFLHTPKIEIFTSNRKVDAISLAGASEVSGVTVLEGHQESQTHEILEEVPGGEEVDNLTEPAPSELGFVVDRDIEESAFDQNPEYPKQSAQGEGSDWMEQEGMPQEETPPRKMKNPFDFLKKLKTPFGGAGSQIARPFLIGFIILLIFVVGGFAAWWYYPKAQVTVYISPRQLDERVDIIVDPGASSSDQANKILLGETVKTTVKGEKTKSTSGTKTIGDKATGEVTLYRVGSKLTLKSGTVLTGPEKLKFILDEDVEIASGSASTPATVAAKVTAETIGAQYNLASNSAFTVGNYTSADIEAKNESDFSGGSSKEISAVSTEDQKSLESELSDELKEKAKEELLSTLPETVIFIDDSLTSSNATKSFTAKVGDEAKSLGLKLSLDAEAVTINKTEMLTLAQDAVKEKIPQGFVLREDQIDTSFEFKKKEGKTYQFQVLVSANLLPEVKTDEIAQKITGKYPSVAQEYFLKEVPGFARAEIILTPKLPGKLGTLPHVTKNVSVEVAAER